MNAERMYRLAEPGATVALLDSILQQDDLVLVKGSRAVGMDLIVAGIAVEQVPSEGEEPEQVDLQPQKTKKRAR